MIDMSDYACRPKKNIEKNSGTETYRQSIRRYTKKTWVRVTRSLVCPICSHPTWCTISSDGQSAHCMRIESNRPCESGGWFHDINGKSIGAIPIQQIKHIEDCTELAKSMYYDHNARQMRELLAVKLGVTANSLERLRVGYGRDEYRDREFASFPSRDDTGKIIGIVRRYGDGIKKTYPGTSNSGLFYDQETIAPKVVWIVEGGSDVAACLSGGVCAVGRPSNTGGAKYLVPLLKAWKCRKICVYGERDSKPERRGEVKQCPKTCNGCPYCAPGESGAKDMAKKLAKHLGFYVGYALPPNGCKDIREWWIRDGSFTTKVVR